MKQKIIQVLRELFISDVYAENNFYLFSTCYLPFNTRPLTFILLEMLFILFGPIFCLFKSIFNSLKLIKKEKYSLKNEVFVSAKPAIVVSIIYLVVLLFFSEIIDKMIPVQGYSIINISLATFYITSFVFLVSMFLSGLVFLIFSFANRKKFLLLSICFLLILPAVIIFCEIFIYKIVPSLRKKLPEETIERKKDKLKEKYRKLND